jgi:FkbM family methyltransferase
VGPLLTAPDKSSFLGMCQEIFEQEIYKFKPTSNQPKIIDCGANIGLATIYFKNKYPKSKVISFEPDPHIFKILQKNIFSARLNDVELINKGLSAISGEKLFFSEKADGGRIATCFDKENIAKVEVTTLSSYLNEDIDLLKIDIEGSEIEVLTECQEKLTKVRNLFVEYHSLTSKKQELAILLKILSEAGFRYYLQNVDLETKTPFMGIPIYFNYDLQLNIFAFRE